MHVAHKHTSGKYYKIVREVEGRRKMVLKNKNETEKNRNKYLNDNRENIRSGRQEKKKRPNKEENRAIRTRRPRHRDQTKIGRQDTLIYRILYPKRHPKTNIF